MPNPLRFDPIDEAGRQWRRHYGGTPVPAMKAVTSVMRVQQVWLARLNEALEPFGLTFARYEALMLLHFTRAGSLPLGKIGVRLQVHPTSVTNLIDGLETRGFVERAPHPSDRRTTLATITPAGRETAEAATQALHAIRFGTGPLGKGELEEITELLRGVRAAAGDFAVAPEGRRAAPER
jgi:DNA-binding MarR family transcriptional regulator